jgi:hypothetical protein
MLERDKKEVAESPDGSGDGFVHVLYGGQRRATEEGASQKEHV